MTKAELIKENEKLKAALEAIIAYGKDDHIEELRKDKYAKEAPYAYATGEMMATAAYVLGKV